MNKKQFAITMLLLLLMGCIALGQILFTDKMINVNVEESNFKNYTILDNKYIYSLPKEWTTEEKKYPGNYIIYYNEFKYDKQGVSGYIEILEDKDDANSIADRNINIIKKDTSNLNLEKSEFKSEKYKGYRIRYDFKTNNSKTYIIQEYIYKFSDRHAVKYRFSIEKDKYNNEDDIEFLNILDKFENK